ncbi:DUF2225 domain-containing protein [Paenibacillus sp. 1001270B_150601_E10]|uniref:DUF2225 domain-containing protein n=1 Tax=Paenibacillus sp. 1001270B_150601_E10 TaxID=2787079 RepID=UPI0018A0DFC2|nr:DUF2225 domain-containing protein [Paenibacillus sp. 1001270B_150601_E10]
MEVEPLYQLTATCPACQHEFRTSRIRPKFKEVSHMDSDFCPHYVKEDLNPDYYVVQVCNQCGCASTEHAKKTWSEQDLAMFKEQVSAHFQPRDYGGERTIGQAIETYKLALLTAQSIRESKRVIAGLLHHIAWLYRYQGTREHEERYLRFALDAYQEVYEKDSGEVNDARLIYMMGELHRRLGEFNEAAMHFSRLIHDKRIMDAAMIRAAREQWAEMREQMQQLKLAVPEGLFEEKKFKI